MNHLAVLAPRRRHAVLVSAALVCRRGDNLAQVFSSALQEAFTPAELGELILQSLLFDGYPCALEGFIALHDLLGDRSSAPPATEDYSPQNLQAWKLRGEDLCRQIYGASYDRLLQNVASLSPALKEWMLIEGYGRVLGRPDLPIDLREMGIIAILTVKDLPRQLQSHLRGALRVGVPAAELQAAIQQCSEFATAEKVASALEIWRKVARSTSEL